MSDIDENIALSQFSYQDLQRAFEERDFSVLRDEFSKFVEWYGDAGKTVNRYE